MQHQKWNNLKRNNTQQYAWIDSKPTTPAVMYTTEPRPKHQDTKKAPTMLPTGHGNEYHTYE